MTKPLPFTQAGLKRAILAAQATGLRVTGIRPDGTLLVEDGPGPVAKDELVTHDAGDPWGNPEA